KRLYDDFLLGDFGIDPRESEIVFSGGRGYHVHVRDRKFQSLSSGERRELVDYLQGTDIEPADAVVEERRSDGLGGRSRRFRTLSPPDAPGWRGRTTRGLLELLDRWEHQGPDVAAAELERTGIDASDARRLARLLLSESGGRRFRESLRLDALSRNVPPQLLSAVLRSATVEVQGETDAPVTTDIHRLIRLPDSLHGGTGFRVVPLDRDRLDAFEPLREAPLPAPAGRTAPVRLLEPVDYPFDPPVVGKAGEAIDLPVPSALFLVLRGEAELRA
ncbi:MAG TPA: DNA primase small subunit domain-containing protein, partial [Thermoplasmata archaeon]|nr:DNA primase small subunit domain-containing protein [Thermoplasmata archaeon]